MKIKTFLILLLTVFSLASCLKSKDQFGWDKDNGSIITGIFDKGYYGETKPYVLNLAPAVESFTDFLSLRYDAPRGNKPSKDIHVKISVANSPTMVADYNAIKAAEALANNTTWTNLVQLPANAYTLSTLEFDIPKDGGEVLVPFTIDKNILNLANTYALGVQITDVSEGVLNELEKNIVVTFLVKNIYDGIYSYVSGQVTRYTSPGVPANDALSGPLGPSLPNVKFVTTGATTLQLQGLQWSPGGGVGGVDPITITVDPATNLTTSSSGTSATFGNWAGHENKYDPATKTFTLNFRWNPTSTTREYSVVFQYAGSR